MAEAPEITLSQALETLGKLQSVAPATTSAKLKHIAGLLQHLANENAYLNTLLVDEMPIASVPKPTAPPPAVATFDDDEEEAESTAEKEEVDLTLFSSLNDALRPPLIAVRGRAELVQAGLLGKITADQDVWLQAIQENTDRAFSVLDAIQEMIAIQKAEIRLEPVNFISTDLLSEGWERIRDRARFYNHEITIQAPEVVPIARGDFYQSLLVLTDMLDNALRYTPTGGQIRLSVDNLGTHVLFSVADTGIGLTPDDLNHIGQPFWRGDHHRMVRQHPGTGLRLYLAKQILALQDGELIFSGEPGLGSTFSFTLRTPD